MALEAGAERDGVDKWFGSGFDVAEAAVEWRELWAEAEDGDVDGEAALAAEAVFSGVHEAAAEAGALMSGVDGQHAKVAAVAAPLSVDGGEQAVVGVFKDEDGAPLHDVGEAGLVGAGAVKEGFNGECGVDEGDEAVEVGGVGDAEAESGDGCAGHRGSLGLESVWSDRSSARSERRVAGGGAGG